MSLEKIAYNTGVELALAEFEKTAFITRILKPISHSYKGRALADRIAPLGTRRILSEIGHGLGDSATGAGIMAALGGSGDDMLLGAAGGLSLGHLGNQMRADKYLKLALKGPNALNKSNLTYLRNNMGDFATGFGSDNLMELLGGLSARNKVDEALRRMK